MRCCKTLSILPTGSGDNASASMLLAAASFQTSADIAADTANRLPHTGFPESIVNVNTRSLPKNEGLRWEETGRGIGSVPDPHVTVSAGKHDEN
jgi:hypothetical protein